jgi:chromosome segregation ATPase
VRSSTETLIKAMRILSSNIQSDEGVANAAIAEAAQRLEEQQERIKRLEEALLEVAPQLTRELDSANDRIKRLEREIEVLRFYGNKGCTAVADKILARNAKI